MYCSVFQPVGRSLGPPGTGQSKCVVLMLLTEIIQIPFFYRKVNDWRLIRGACTSNGVLYSTTPFLNCEFFFLSFGDHPWFCQDTLALGVFDGHSGGDAAQFAQEELIGHIKVLTSVFVCASPLAQEHASVETDSTACYSDAAGAR